MTGSTAIASMSNYFGYPVGEDRWAHGSRIVKSSSLSYCEKYLRFCQFEDILMVPFLNIYLFSRNNRRHLSEHSVIFERALYKDGSSGGSTFKLCQTITLPLFHKLKSSEGDVNPPSLLRALQVRSLNPEFRSLTTWPLRLFLPEKRERCGNRTRMSSGNLPKA